MSRHFEKNSRSAWLMLDAIRQAQTRFIVDEASHDCFDDLLKILLSITESEYGFIGEVFNKADGVPYLKTHAITNIAWNEETRALFDSISIPLRRGWSFITSRHYSARC